MVCQARPPKTGALTLKIPTRMATITGKLQLSLLPTRMLPLRNTGPQQPHAIQASSLDRPARRGGAPLRGDVNWQFRAAGKVYPSHHANISSNFTGPAPSEAGSRAPRRTRLGPRHLMHPLARGSTPHEAGTRQSPAARGGAPLHNTHRPAGPRAARGREPGPRAAPGRALLSH